MPRTYYTHTTKRVPVKTYYKHSTKKVSARTYYAHAGKKRSYFVRSGDIEVTGRSPGGVGGFDKFGYDREGFTRAMYRKMGR